MDSWCYVGLLLDWQIALETFIHLATTDQEVVECADLTALQEQRPKLVIQN